MIPYPKLIKGILIQRYKRFLADVEITGADGKKEIVTAHCANTGSMKSCYETGSIVYLSPSTSRERKLKFSWELVECAESLVGRERAFIGINTNLPNKVVLAALRAQAIPELSEYETVRGEVKYGKNSRIDALLECSDGRRCYIEVKNVSFRVGDSVQFPDAVTERGLKHMKELRQLVDKHTRAVMFYFVNRPDSDVFKPAREIDPAYCDALFEAYAVGVELLAYRAKTTLDGIGLGEKIKIDLN